MENKDTDVITIIRVDVTRPMVDTISGIVYKQVKRLRAVDTLKMTVMSQRTKSKKPAVLYFPGGGFTTSDHEKFTELRYSLARAGFFVAACEYRTVPTKYPALIEDAKAAVRFLRSHADEFGIDASRIAVIGDSAGGYVAQMLGATNGAPGFDVGDDLSFSSDVQAVVSLYGICDLLTIGEGLGFDKVHASPAVTEALLINGPAFGGFAGASIFDSEKAAKAASPIFNVKGGEPPFLIMHGSRDRLVSPSQSMIMHKELLRHGSRSEHVIVEGAGHGDLPWFQEQTVDLITKWLAKEFKVESV